MTNTAALPNVSKWWQEQSENRAESCDVTVGDVGPMALLESVRLGRVHSNHHCCWDTHTHTHTHTQNTFSPCQLRALD